jgi:hypothetical protein
MLLSWLLLTMQCKRRCKPAWTIADMHTIKLLVVDDHTLFRRGLIALVARRTRACWWWPDAA